MIFFNVLCAIGFNVLYYNKFVNSDQNLESSTETVQITSSSSIKYIEVPTSDDPVITWMEVRKGTFPNVANDLISVTNVSVGDPLTLFIFYKDGSNMYDVTVTDCWAYDEEDILLSKQKIHLHGSYSKGTSGRILKKWKKVRSRNSPSFLYTSFTSFKFPDKDEIYFMCDIQLIGRERT